MCKQSNGSHWQYFRTVFRIILSQHFMTKLQWPTCPCCVTFYDDGKPVTSMSLLTGITVFTAGWKTTKNKKDLIKNVAAKRKACYTYQIQRSLFRLGLTALGASWPRGFWESLSVSPSFISDPKIAFSGKSWRKWVLNYNNNKVIKLYWGLLITRWGLSIQLWVML